VLIMTHPLLPVAGRAIKALTRLWPRAQVRSGGGQQSPFLDELLAAQGAAETQGFGLFTKVSSAQWREDIHIRSCSGAALSMLKTHHGSLCLLRRTQRR